MKRLNLLTSQHIDHPSIILACFISFIASCRHHRMFPFDFLTLRPVLTTTYVEPKAKLASLPSDNYYGMESMDTMFIPAVSQSGWFYTNEQNKAVGPIDVIHLQHLYFESRIHHYTYVFNYDHRTNWFRICDYEALHQLLHQYQAQSNETETETETDHTETETVQSKPVTNPTSYTNEEESLKHKIENIWSDLSSSSPSVPPIHIDFTQDDDHLISFDDSSLKVFAWNTAPNQCERFYVRFEPLTADFEFQIMLEEHQKRKNETTFRLLHKNMTDLKLKNKVDSLLNFINSKRSKEEQISVECHAKPLMERVKQIFSYHIYDNKEILFGRDTFRQFCIENTIEFDTYCDQLQALEDTVIEEWRNKLFAAVALDLFYETVVKGSTYGMVYSLHRLDNIIKNKLNYFLVSRTYFGFLMRVPLIKITVTSSKVIEPIKLHQIGSQLKGTHFGRRPSWIEIYFSGAYCVENEHQIKQSINNGFVDCEEAVHFGDIIGEIQYILKDDQGVNEEEEGEREDRRFEYDELQRYDMMRLWIENEERIMAHQSIVNIEKEEEEEWLRYVESGVTKNDIVYVMKQFQRVKRKFILETPQRTTAHRPKAHPITTKQVKPIPSVSLSSLF
eukprot:402520_1